MGNQPHPAAAGKKLNLHAGDLVQVKSYDEIRAMLDADGTYAGLPFMPEMRKFCGRKVRVAKRANRFCYEGSRMRIMKDTVFLEGMRCDGLSHDGCNKACMVFWNEDLLTRADGEPTTDPYPAESALPSAEGWVTKEGDRYYCQSSQLANATQDWKHSNFKPFVEDITSGNMTVWELTKALWITFARMFGPRSYLKVCGDLFGVLSKTPGISLGLQPGEWVQVKSAEEIMATLDKAGRNRGMQFAPEMLEHCGKKYQVLHRVEKIILERSGMMQPLKDTVILKNVGCGGACRKGCPRDTYPFWREAWLTRVP